MKILTISILISLFGSINSILNENINGKINFTDPKLNKISDKQQINHTVVDLRQQNRQKAENLSQISDFQGPLVMKIGSQFYTPSKNKNVSEIQIGFQPYVPVEKVAPESVDSAISSFKEFKDSYAINVENQTYIPLKSIPEIFTSQFRVKKQIVKKIAPQNQEKQEPIVIKIEGELYKPNKNESLTDRFIGGIDYVPVQKIPSGNQKNIILPTNIIKHIFVVDVEKQFYIPYVSIPQQYQQYFRKPQPLDVIIKIENEHYGPSKKANLTKIRIGGLKYIPVSIVSPSNKTLTIFPSKDFSEAFVVEKQNIIYIPQKSIPKIHLAAFLRPLKKVQVDSACLASAVAITVDNKNFVPNLDEDRFHIFWDGILYIPVVKCKKSQNFKKIVQPSGDANQCMSIQIHKFGIIKNDMWHLLPYDCIPESQKDLYVKEYIYSIPEQKRDIKAVVTVDGKQFKPTYNTNVKAVNINGLEYIPVDIVKSLAEIDKFIMGKNRNSSIIYIKNQAYIPLTSIPQALRSTFKNSFKKQEAKAKPVIQINGENYIPLQNKTIKPIYIKNIPFIPVKAAPESLKNSPTIIPKKKGQIETFNVENITYIPLSVIPRTFRPVFKKNEVEKKKPKSIIKVNGQHYIPIDNNSTKAILFNGKTYIPVQSAPKYVDKKSAIEIKQKGKIDTFEIGKITYIPLNVIPKEQRAVFKPKYNESEKKQVKSAIKINGQNFIPIKNKTVKNLEINGVTYIPVSPAPKSIKISSVITPNNKGQIDTFKKGNITYIPLDVIPKKHRAVFKPKPSKNQVPLKNYKAIIKINGENYIPITKKSIKPIFIKNVTYIPVRTAPNNSNNQTVIVPKSKSPIETFKIGEITYIPLNVIPKKQRAVFKPKVKSSAKKSSEKTVIRINGKHYIPIKNMTVKNIVVNGVNYIPVKEGPNHVNKSSAIIPKSNRDIDIFKKGDITYIPFNVIPKKHRAVFNPVKKVSPPKQSAVSKKQPVLSVNNGFYVPVKDKKYKKVVVDGVVYIPVRKIPSSEKKSSKVLKANGKKIDTFQFGNNITYIPILSVPKQVRKEFYSPTSKKKIPAKNLVPSNIKIQQPKSTVKIPVDTKAKYSKCDKQVPIKRKQEIIIKGAILIPAAPLVIAGHTYIPFTSKSNKTIKSNEIIKKLNKSIKIGNQTFEVNQKEKILTINGVIYIPVSIQKQPNLKKKSSKPVKKQVKKAQKKIVKKAKKVKKCEKQIPIKKRQSFKVKGVVIVPAAPKVISGHTYIPFTTKYNKTIETKEILKQLKKYIKVGNSTFKVDKSIKTILINGVHYIPVTQIKKQSKHVAVKKHVKRIPIKDQTKSPVKSTKIAPKPKKAKKVIKKKIVVHKHKAVKKVHKKKPANKKSCKGNQPVPVKKVNFKNDGIKKKIIAKRQNVTKKNLGEIQTPSGLQKTIGLYQLNLTQESQSPSNSNIIQEILKADKQQKLLIKKQKLIFIGDLFKKFYTLDKNKYFEKPQTFHFIQLQIIKDKPKISIVQSVQGRSLKQVLRLFRFVIENKFVNSHEQYGIIGSNQLIFSTSPFRKFYEANSQDLDKLVKYNSNGKEYLKDNISKLFVGYGFYKQIISLPKNVVKGNSQYLIRIDPKSLKGETINVKTQSAQKEFEKNAKDKSKIYFLFNSKGKLIKQSKKNFKSFVTLVSFLQKFGNFNGVILNENKLNVSFRKGAPSKFHQNPRLAFSPRTKRLVKSSNKNKQVEKENQNPCKQYKDGSKRQQVCKLNNQYRGSKQPLRLSKKYNFGAVVYDPIKKQMSKASDNLNSNMRRGLKYVKWNLLQKYVKKPTNFQFLVFSENGPLTCSNKKASKECQKMLGYSLTQGWWKSNRKFIDSSVDNQFYLMVRNEKTKKIQFTNMGCNKKEAIEKLKSLTKKDSIGAVLNRNAELIEKTVTNPKNHGDMQFEEIYAMIGQYYIKDLQLFKETPKNEKEAGLI